MKRSYYLINAITLYRLIAAPILIILIITKDLDLFKWLLALSFFTDLIDGFLARKFKVTSILGSRLDSIADDSTVVAALIGLFVFKYDFVQHELIFLFGLLGLFLTQNIIAIIKYHKITSFHTYLAKISAILQGLFFILIFLLQQPVYFLFYTAVLFTALDLIEEIILVFLLPKWEANVKGLFSVLKRKQPE
ncbi:MAG: CDP-alcohol phosphatidyltransferase family protein [Bacteroidetes bacterium]|nr:MAG: CDP-alcohol phosphatidyltransferase family protein [Bacteroidota bacterium]